MNRRSGTVGTLLGLSTYTRAHTYLHRGTSVPSVPDPDRWHVVVALLRAPAAEARRLGKLLEAWPAERHRHLQGDDCRRRLWKRGNA